MARAVTAGTLPLVLVPGLLCTERLFAAQRAALAADGVPVHVADTLHDDSLDGFAQRLLAHAPAHFALAGLSMGGYIAFEVMRTAPERVAKLALLDTSARPDVPEQTARRHALIALAQGGAFAEVVAQHYPLFVATARANDPTLRALVETMAQTVGAAAYVRQQRAIMARPDARPRLAEIACPTLVVVGEDDRLTPPELAAELATAIPGAVCRVVAGSGHLAPAEAPEEVTAALRAWLAG
ncbi:MAG: alpha/beta fold hydrolase [Vulcanimicrobiaceae bacterium]|jgi:pimeloyl-ACP methyl ester carboxylesterase